ncbi:MAG: hypothetical protein IPO70_07390 [Bacteroidetes bacterium]|nr:hypothetical protein [Bacteroidota bacterium]MBK9672065.1 hypothetical protein [Bacteroidota bacterium]MBP6413334.1 hypothetical protein [Bacteroidia bacterium]
MNTKKILLGSFAGAVTYFLLGWLIYGMLLMDYMTNSCPNIPGLNRNESEMLLWVMFISNLLSAFLMAYIFDLAKISGWMNGMKQGAIIGFIITAAFDTGMYAMTFMLTKNWLMIDVLASTVMAAIVGAVVAAVMGMSDKN